MHFKESSKKDKKNVIFCLLIIVFTLIACSPILTANFTNWDDTTLLLRNPFIRSLNFDNIQYIFKNTFLGTYIPLTVLSFSFEYHFFNDNPFIYHFTNLILHLLVTVLIYSLALRLGLTSRAAFLSALIFSIHPMHIEPVAWISERKGLLCTFFYLASLHYYLQYLANHHKKKYIFAILLGLLSILSKPMAFSLPLALFILDWLVQRKLDIRVFLDKIPFLLIIVPFCLLTLFENNDLGGYPIGETLIVWIWTFTFHIAKFFIPLQLSPLYDLPKPIALSNPLYALMLFIFLGIIFFILRCKSNKWILFAALFYLATISMLIIRSIWDFGNLTVVADRFMYLPSIGICIAIGVILDQFLMALNQKKTSVQYLAYCLLICLFSILIHASYQQTKIWNNNITLWSHVINLSPQNATAYHQRGSEFYAQKEYQAALLDFNNAIKHNPQYAHAFNNRGLTNKHMKDYTKALADFNEAIRLSPKLAKAYSNRGNLYTDLNQFESSRQDLNRAIELNPYLEDAYVNRGVLNYTLSNHSAALDNFTKAIDINPRYALAHNNMGLAYMALSNFENAYKSFTNALALDSTSSDFYNNRGIMFARINEWDFAIDDFNQSILFADESKYENVHEAYNNRGNIYFKKGQYHHAISDYNKAIEIYPQYASAYFNRSGVYREVGNISQALADALKAKELGFPNISQYIDQIRHEERRHEEREGSRDRYPL